MSVSTTIDKLVEMRMTTMSEMFRNQQNDPKMKDVPCQLPIFVSFPTSPARTGGSAAPE